MCIVKEKKQRELQLLLETNSVWIFVCARVVVGWYLNENFTHSDTPQWETEYKSTEQLVRKRVFAVRPSQSLHYPAPTSSSSIYTLQLFAALNLFLSTAFRFCSRLLATEPASQLAKVNNHVLSIIYFVVSSIHFAVSVLSFINMSRRTAFVLSNQCLWPSVWGFLPH